MRFPPPSKTGPLIALVYLVVVFGLDYLGVDRGSDTAAVALYVITFPSGFLTTIAFLLLGGAVGFDEYSPGPDSYAPSVYAVAGIVQVLLVWLAWPAWRSLNAFKYRTRQ
ncbi:hypothetical protein [Streptomyces geranii]|uniref:hypothetical protein n=1 Tax=Streptomyces geranii TaxID=2058923 RepID=UPI000D023AFD|nr:hypothetical protein [Streptomyces geranii]